ncbi:MAG TPA: hypothetical protein VMX38_08350 [Verrucomicrobiae bacterium]|jgi:Spy/CpxP family protein refolding chaperone|nr:hypothetical protein [Verrucomicrobiae bacterium]
MPQSISRSISLLTVSLFFLAALSVAQSSSPQAPSSPQPQAPSSPQAQQPRQMRQGNFTPCWQQAGIEKSVMEQRWAQERETHSQVQAICSNSSLTPQEKNQQVREIRRQAREKMEGLITPEQEKALTACQQERGMNHPAAGRWGRGGCGEWQNGGPHPGGTPNGSPNSPANNGSGADNGAPPPSSSQPN